jgi:hypothetical protein
VLTPGNNPIARGLKLVGGTYIGQSSIFNLGFPRGLFTIVDSTGNGQDPTLNSLGRENELVFIGLSEFDLSGFATRTIGTPEGATVPFPTVLTPVTGLDGLTGTEDQSFDFYILDEGTFQQNEDSGEVSFINVFGYAFFR